MAAVELHLRIRVREGGLEDLVGFLRRAVPFYESPGGIRVRLLQSGSDPSRLIEVVEYESEDAYRRDEERVASDPEMGRLLAEWRALLAEPPSVEVYRDETARIRGG